MDPTHPGRNRPVDVTLRPFLVPFIRRLSQALGWQGETQSCKLGRAVGESPENRWFSHVPNRFAVDHLMSEILSKFDDSKSSDQKESKTWERFWEAEDLCSQANMFFLRRDPAHFSTSELGVWSILEVAKRKISRLLGPYNARECEAGMSFTTGASYRLKRQYGNPVYKYSASRAETSFDNLPKARRVISRSPLWANRPVFAEGPCPNLLLEVVPGNRLISVPKNYKTNRMIAIEPRMNMYVQKGIGKAIRRRLKRIGIDLDLGQKTHGDLARLGSATGGLATIDLSMASDTVSLELVRFLLPADWLRRLERARSLFGVLPSGEKHLYRKFSSMGNGYTFELESLIFWAISSAVCSTYGVSERLMSVYGDDIIVPASVGEPLCAILSTIGFRVNMEKSHIAGRFRESCGEQYLSGYDVTPFYIKEEDRSLVGLFTLHNQLYRWLHRQRRNGFEFPKAWAVIAWLRGLAPADWRRPRIPDGYGDGAFIGTFDQAHPTPVPSGYLDGEGWEGYVCEVLSTVSVSYRLGSRFVGDAYQWLLVMLKEHQREPLDYLGEVPPVGVEKTRRVRQIKLIVPHFES